ncbi:acyltransferase family protein [Bradyrhizobium lablabi]|uniref:acyltransferase family protein n=1 Tax=Bradyrhizobium lablabi TaxID=722472 RepID=UPI00090B77ED|nr:acyltransferase [Bradyrhizobium lablabi]SHM85913.1 Acyltransferase family protein [Bradyrhizobium lablabi]
MNIRLAELDGLRGIAIGLVVLFHFGLIPVGWVGVQLFFVLSGYLISELLINEKEQAFSTYTAQFYWRRSLRIFPLYFIYLASMAALHFATGAPESLQADWPYLLTYTTNFGRLRTIDIGPAFTHLWSLAVEEQFYLLWPFVVYILSLRSLKRTIVGVILISPILRAGFYVMCRRQGYDEEFIGRAIYVLPFMQLDSFAFGAAVAAWKLGELPSFGRLTLGTGFLTALLGVACSFMSI